MLWISLSIIGTILVKMCAKRNEDKSLIMSDKFIFYAIITVLFITTSFIQFGMGVGEYPSLSKDLSQINSLKKRVQDIRNASYNYKENGKLVAGSIENMNQSTNLSKYIAELALKEAEYSGNLKSAKVHKEVFALSFFSYGWAISNEIYKLEVIEN